MNNNAVVKKFFSAIGKSVPVGWQATEYSYLVHKNIYNEICIDIRNIDLSSREYFICKDSKKVSPIPFHTKEGAPLIAYHKTQRPDFSHAYTYHLCWCTHLREKIGEIRFVKDYAICTNHNGVFPVFDLASQQIVYKKMRICYNCLNMLYPGQNRNPHKFDLEKYYYDEDIRKNISQAIFREARTIGTIYEVQENHGYALNWAEISKNLKKAYNYKCQDCGKSFIDIYGNLKTGLEVHHIDERRENNAPSNLRVVCKNCHDKYHPGRPGAFRKK